jgi:hypothetical protein
MDLEGCGSSHNLVQPGIWLKGPSKTILRIAGLHAEI